MRREIDDQAARWIARRASGAMSDEEAADYAAWLAADPRRRAAITEFEAMLSGLEPGADALLSDSFEQELHSEWSAAEALNAPRSGLMPRRAIAASLAMAVVAATIAVFMLPAQQMPIETRYATAFGERREIALEDGTRVTLNANTTLLVGFTKTDRLLRLEKGEGLFEVARDLDRPFSVKTRLGAAVAVGTAFSVELVGDVMRVGVAEGVVRVSGDEDGAAALVDAGRSIVVDSGGVETLSDFDAGRELAWRNGRAIFVDAEIDAVVSDLNRYFEKPIIVAAPALQSVRVSGEFDIDDPSAAAEALAIAFGADVRETPSALLLVENFWSPK